MMLVWGSFLTLASFHLLKLITKKYEKHEIFCDFIDVFDSYTNCICSVQGYQ